MINKAPTTPASPGETDDRQARYPNSDHNAQHLATDHLLTNIKGRTISSGFVTISAQGVQFVLSLVSIAVLARLLAPHDFGLVAMVTTIMGFLRIFNEAGLSTATVQREGITHAQVSNLFWTNLALGGTVSLVLAAAAPAVAWFYREPRLIGVTLALSITFLLTSSAVQHLALLKRQMRFRVIAFIQIGSMACGVMVGISMAWMNYGYWSLVGMQLCTPVVAFLLTWWAAHWRPQWPRRRSGTRSLLNFGANLTASSFLWSLARGSDGLLIGRFYGPTALGLYSRGASLLSRPLEQFMSPLEAVFVPTLSRLQSQPERYRRILLNVYEVVALTSCLFAGLFLALSRPLTLLVLGPKWENAAPIFAAFTLVALFIPVSSVTTWLLTSQGRGRDFLLGSLFGSSVTVMSFIVGLPFGPVGMAISYSSTCLIIDLPIGFYLGGRRGPVRTGDLWSRFLTYLPLWGIVCSVTFSLYRLVPDFSPILQLLLCGTGGLLVGAIFISVYPPARRTILHLFSVLKSWREASEVATSEIE